MGSSVEWGCGKVYSGNGPHDDNNRNIPGDFWKQNIFNFLYILSYWVYGESNTVVEEISVGLAVVCFIMNKKKFKFSCQGIKTEFYHFFELIEILNFKFNTSIKPKTNFQYNRGCKTKRITKPNWY